MTQLCDNRSFIKIPKLCEGVCTCSCQTFAVRTHHEALNPARSSIQLANLLPRTNVDNTQITSVILVTDHYLLIRIEDGGSNRIRRPEGYGRHPIKSRIEYVAGNIAMKILTKQSEVTAFAHGDWYVRKVPVR